MPVALMSSGGKDSTLALDRARRNGYDVGALVNIYDGASGRVAFHGVRRELIEAQAEACGLCPILRATTADQPYEPVFLDTLAHLSASGYDGVVFGNIHLADVRAWFETRVTDAGLHHIEPLWQEAPAALLAEVVDRGFRAIVVSVDLAQGASDQLGAALDHEFAETLAGRPKVDPCGERGEYHTFVYAGPAFERPLRVVPGVTREERNHRLLDLTLDR